MCDQLIELITLASGAQSASTGALPVPEAEMQKARELLPPGRIYVGIAPGAGDLTKAWPRFKFAKLAQMQAEKGRVPVFILGPLELNWYDELKATVPLAKFPLQEYGLWGEHAITLEHTLAIGRLLDVAIANDSGVGHMLAAADCPLISLFGPTSPDKLAPRVTNGIVIRAQNFGSSLIRKITWEAVNDAIENLLSKKVSK
jgi:ADP-heptose:LPS heptosyltransferase